MTTGQQTVYLLSSLAQLSPDKSSLLLVGRTEEENRTIPLHSLEEEADFLKDLAQGMSEERRGRLLAKMPPKRRIELLALFEALRRQGWVAEQLCDAGEVLLTRKVISDWYEPRPADPAESYSFSRFALLRSHEEGLLLESPRSHARIVLTKKGLMLCTDILVQGVAAGWDGDTKTGAIVQMLVECGFLVRRNSDGSSAEDLDRKLQDWDFHDLLFHARSRAGRHRDAYGKTKPGISGFDDGFAETENHLVTVGEPIILPKPDLDDLAQEDRPFGQVLESRRSSRKTPVTPLTLGVLAQFLFRSARIRQRDAASPIGAWRPFASAAGLNDLDLFLNVYDCQGLEPGFYRYDGINHMLEQIDARVDALKRLESFSGVEPLGVHVLLAARFGKANCRYDSIAYSLILRNAGCLLQTMYLVATALDRAPCAIGAGDADIFARITGLPYELQGTVGDFVLR